MAAAGGGSGGGGGFPVLPLETTQVTGDLVSELQFQLTSLRTRVEELERKNEILLSQLSRCRCSKGEGPAFIAEDSGSPREAHHEEFHIARTVESCMSLTSDNLITSSSNLVKWEEDRQVNGFGKKSTMRAKDMKNGSSGCHVKPIHRAKRYIALKIMYFGLRFYGFASEAQMDPTVESEIFKALERTRLLVGNKEDSHYSRCGRTDKGVSSTGQVISLYVRSNLRKTGGNTKNGVDLEEQYEEEIDYVRVLNRVLPEDIRVFGWCPVPTEFHARFSCLSREYRYLFWRGSLDLSAMEEATKKFIGKYDFRNFCKMDAANVSNYRRKITSFEITSCNRRSGDDELWAMTVRGSAFLWHQVRCMVAVLFMIGQGLESPNVLDVLLDTNKTPRKPQYVMAPELPLILRFCEFEGLNFICSADARQALAEHLKSEYQRYMLQATIFYEALDCLSMPEESPSELIKKNKGHISLMLRPTEPSYEERCARLKAKGIQKSLVESSKGG